MLTRCRISVVHPTRSNFVPEPVRLDECQLYAVKEWSFFFTGVSCSDTRQLSL